MKKIVLFQLNQLGYGGTEKAIYTFLENLDSSKYIGKVFFQTDYKSFDYYRRKILSLFSKKYEKSFYQKYTINFARKDNFENLVGRENFYIGTQNDFFNLIQKEHIDIIHFNRGNEEDFYTRKIDLIPYNIKLVETNIFGNSSNEKYLKRLSGIFFVSKWLKSKALWAQEYPCKVLYNPIITPKTKENLKEEYNIPHDYIILGRISRPNLDDGGFILNVLNQVLDSTTNIIFLIVGATDIFKDKVKEHKNIICIEPTTDEIFLSKFYNTLDILLHYRKEGETFGMNIAEAMIHGKPVISHYSSVDNAQAELLLENKISGIVVEENNLIEYINSLNYLINNLELRLQYSLNARQKADANYSEKFLTEKLEKYYRELNV